MRGSIRTGGRALPGGDGLRRAIRESTRDMTVFIVSQRVSSIRQADAILVLDDAHLAGVGTHEALMRDCAVYREIALSQEKEAKA